MNSKIQNYDFKKTDNTTNRKTSDDYEQDNHVSSSV